VGRRRLFFVSVEFFSALYFKGEKKSDEGEKGGTLDKTATPRSFGKEGVHMPEKRTQKTPR